MANKKWSPKMKFKIALLALKNETTISEICNQYQVSPSQVHAWKKQIMDEGSQIFEKQSKSKAAKKKSAAAKGQTESQLYEKIGQLTVERDFLKKTWEKLQGNVDED